MPSSNLTNASRFNVPYKQTFPKNFPNTFERHIPKKKENTNVIHVTLQPFHIWLWSIILSPVNRRKRTTAVPKSRLRNVNCVTLVTPQTQELLITSWSHMFRRISQKLLKAQVNHPVSQKWSGHSKNCALTLQQKKEIVLKYFLHQKFRFWEI